MFQDVEFMLQDVELVLQDVELVLLDVEDKIPREEETFSPSSQEKSVPLEIMGHCTVYFGIAFFKVIVFVP